MDAGTLKKIATLHPTAQAWAKAHIDAINNSGILPAGWSARVVSGNRTWAEQNELYAQGRTKPGPIVTKARGGQSNHNFGIAWDIGIFNDKGQYLGESPYYRSVAKIGKAMGLEWGGDWQSIVDTPHYQVKTGLSLAQLRSLMSSGKPIPVPTYGGTVIAISDTPKSVQVFDNDELTTVPAQLIEGSTWVGLREFCNVFGGTIDKADVSSGGSVFIVTIDNHGMTLNGKVIGGVGMVKFVDINKAHEWPYEFKDGKLTIHTKEHV